jgi:hypothetical protein
MTRRIAPATYDPNRTNAGGVSYDLGVRNQLRPLFDRIVIK